MEGATMSERAAAVPGVTNRLIKELNKIVEDRQDSVRLIRERIGFSKPDPKPSNKRQRKSSG